LKHRCFNRGLHEEIGNLSIKVNELCQASRLAEALPLADIIAQICNLEENAWTDYRRDKLH